jgi:hypothetical protein
MKTETYAAEMHRVEFWREAPAASPVHQLALHISQPASDNQSEAEISLPGYQRVAVTRDAKSWQIAGRSVRNAVLVRFPTILSGNQTAAWISWGIGGRIRRLAKLKTPVQLKMNHRIEFEPGELEIEEMP